MINCGGRIRDLSIFFFFFRYVNLCANYSEDGRKRFLKILLIRSVICGGRIRDLNIFFF